MPDETSPENLPAVGHERTGSETAPEAEYDDYDDDHPDNTCPRCGGNGGDPMDDYCTPCDHCDGEGYEYWK